MPTPVEKIAIVTGAYRGIGFEVCRQLARAGFRVFMSARNEAKAQKPIEALAREGLRAEFLAMDVADAESIRKAAKAYGEKARHLDVLINNAAVYPDKTHNLVETDSKILEECYRVNTLGPIRVTQAFAPFLEKSLKARVINVSSGAGALTTMPPYTPAYAISKAALNAATRQFSFALKDRGISVNSACPGWVRTEMGGPDAPRSVEQGADGIVWLALDAPQDLTGKFLRDRAEIAW